MGLAIGWNLWVWLECIGVVSGCCFKEVYYGDVMHSCDCKSAVKHDGGV